jgi:hypothetical protein
MFGNSIDLLLQKRIVLNNDQGAPVVASRAKFFPTNLQNRINSCHSAMKMMFSSTKKPLQTVTGLCHLHLFFIFEQIHKKSHVST